ncbi:LAMI_0B08900g1_1 [Lachancea mirantina]|uniref:LAMI_0B08900g1_1 n=1 Tax=Lachancea mirantina TaxID=1230905 RepID=A0A1G4IY96_9SACH|nr:LAMI_0B08900g1_1 [Lachancea mirantina]
MAAIVPPEKLAIIKAQADFWAHSMRSPIVRTPEEYGLKYEDISFPSYDQVALKGWFFPCEGSNKLIICNHPMPMNRYGYPGHLDEFKQLCDFEVNFLPEYKVLHDAGYNVLCYDQRNHGESEEGDGGVAGAGRHEWKDSVGVKRWVDKHPVYSKMTLGLMSRCMGANAQFEAISRYPELFDNVKCIVAPQPVTARYPAEAFCAQLGILDEIDVLEEEIRKLGGWTTTEMGPKPFVPKVHIPTLISQVHDDTWTKPEDVETIFELLGAEQKKLFWIEGTTRRFDGYNYFGEHPEEMLAWYAKYM